MRIDNSDNNDNNGNTDDNDNIFYVAYNLHHCPFLTRSVYNAPTVTSVSVDGPNIGLILSGLNSPLPTIILIRIREGEK